MKTEYHPLVKRLLDGELMFADLPPELRAEAEQALRWVAALDRTPVVLSARLDERVMAQVRRHAQSPAGRVWRWLVGSREIDIRLHVRPWALGVAAAAAVALVVLRPGLRTAPRGGAPTYVRFIFYAPGARTVSVAGTFNQWNPAAAPLVPTTSPGVWTTTVALPLGQHQYAFVVDGMRWVPDPAAPTVDDGFGQRNSVVAVAAQDGGGRAL
jgi:hypothetical protein